jgi:cation transport ATPase
MHTHIHTHLRACTHVRMRTHKHTRTHIRTHAQVHNACTHVCTQSYTHARTQCTLTHMSTHAHTHTHMHTHKHARTGTHAHVHTHAYVRVHTRVHTHAGAAHRARRPSHRLALCLLIVLPPWHCSHWGLLRFFKPRIGYGILRYLTLFSTCLFVSCLSVIFMYAARCLMWWPASAVYVVISRSHTAAYPLACLLLFSSSNLLKCTIKNT